MVRVSNVSFCPIEQYIESLLEVKFENTKSKGYSRSLRGFAGSEQWQ